MNLRREIRRVRGCGARAHVQHRLLDASCSIANHCSIVTLHRGHSALSATQCNAKFTPRSTRQRNNTSIVCRVIHAVWATIGTRCLYDSIYLPKYLLALTRPVFLPISSSSRACSSSFSVHFSSSNFSQTRELSTKTFHQEACAFEKITG